MELVMLAMQYIALGLFSVCLVGFIGVYMIFLYNLATELGVKLSTLVTKIVGA
tara:strand:- start:658 stop:816 length:159 start_codon:yes stop_codon:yes gene_type:complete